ncbi:adenylate cyclase type 10-like [Chelonus insularis]|uniref:adenylate cyclase type 10-like n=1 Tax=Chelonus insularis TaxID=460826 RepID=UPI00158B0251|nr:adenylate cyclase type 10-like [Chelonus insularis]
MLEYDDDLNQRLKMIAMISRRLTKNSDKKKSELQRIEKHTEIFASMCPDEILDHYNDYNTREYYTTLMLGDISGFTELAEKYTTSGKSGPSKITETLNSYIGPMIQEILSHHGDVLKFSGDAFMVMWKLQNGMVMRDLATEAIQTACIIQKYFGTYETDIGVTLRVKIAIASGKTYFTSIGDPQWMSHYIITGKPMWDAKSAEALCRGGDILVAPSSWQWANPKDYVFKILPDSGHTLILRGSTMWESSKETYGDKISTIDHSVESSSINSPPATTHPAEIDTTFSNFKDQIRHNRLQSIDYSLRPKVIKVAKNRLKNELKSYMLRPVIHSVDLDEPLEHLAEIRQVVIVFINIVTDIIGRKKLIVLVNKSFQLICKIVDELQGCVNKVSLFDKDLMFLCIFGLKGGKQELEAQIALRCASRLKSALSTIKNINSVTVGISTGMTYCGVVGHILRREYTVIGMPVNKAARLMVTYNNKIVCDRESFLHSRLEASHFTLQKPKYLKGISNVGPIYEFVEQVRIHDSDNKIKLPLFNRQSEIRLFRTLFKQARENWRNKLEFPLKDMNSILIVRGEPRIGKTRLLDEMTQIIPEDIAYHYITLTYNDYQIPYKLIDSIFRIPMRLKASYTLKDRQKILLNCLESTNHSKNLSLLNPVFNVNFENSAYISSLSKQLKNQILCNLITQMVIKCFNEPWIIFIDDVENADEESLNVMPTIINQHRILFILGLIDDEKEIHSVWSEKAEIIKLKGLDKCCHVGLACQFLKVDAIEPELEKVIQEKSHGNPGWIESFLVSLLQVGGIEITTISKEQLNETDFVIPLPTMIRSSTCMNSKKKLKRKDEWEMYETSYERDISFFHGKEEITICKISSDFDINDATAELTTDVTFLKTFDSLKPLDQILLKCAAVLGETIDRNLLEKLMEKTSIRDIALTIVKIFKMRILGCATGNVDHSYTQLSLLKSMKDINRNIEIECKCMNVEIRESLSDLPKYASCKHLQFKFAKFRAATYRLLTENQKIEFHKKALRYLQYSTKKCIPCGENFNDLTKVSTSAIFYTNSDSEKKLKERRLRKWFHYVARRSEPKLIPKTFSNFNFIHCECNSILIATYTQILNHCRGIDRKDKALIAMLEFIEILLATSNVPQAKKLLNSAEEILIHTYVSRDDELVTVPCLKAKLKTFQARCNLQLELIDEAEKNLEEALNIMGYYIPKNTIIIRLKTKLFYQQLKLSLIRSKQSAIETYDDEAAEYYCQLSRSLSQLFKIYQTKGSHNHAQLVAIWSLNAALNGMHDFIALCYAHANMITIFSDKLKNPMILEFLINDIIKICNEKKGDISELELRAILHLYASIFYFYWKKVDIIVATKMGSQSLLLAQNVSSIQYQLEILPRLIMLLTAQCRYKKIVDLLKQIEFISRSSTNKSDRMWFYILCLNFQIDTGIILITAEQCEEYYQEEGKMIVKTRDYDLKNRFFTLMWLWYLRTKKWETSTIWKIKRINVITPKRCSTEMALITEMNKLEGLLLCCGKFTI